MEEGPIFVHIPGVPEVLTMSWIVMGLIILFGAIASFSLKRAPKGMQNMAEFAIEWVVDKTKEFMGETGPKFLPLFLVLFLFIFFSNLIGLIPGFKSPTSNLSINLALALIIFFSTQYFGIREKGFINYFKHLIEPQVKPLWLYYITLAPLFLIIHTISELVRPISLTLRLFFNILAKEILLSLLASLFLIFLALQIPPVKIWIFDVSGPIKGFLITLDAALRPAIILLGALVSFIQALVFTALSMIYIGTAISHEEH